MENVVVYSVNIKLVLIFKNCALDILGYAFSYPLNTVIPLFHTIPRYT